VAGGAAGSGARLTDFGYDLLDRHRRIEGVSGPSSPTASPARSRRAPGLGPKV
jgi:molybdenum-dependent DNA-binding transcriptional regulator ModE